MSILCAGPFLGMGAVLVARDSVSLALASGHHHPRLLLCFISCEYTDANLQLQFLRE